MKLLCDHWKLPLLILLCSLGHTTCDIDTGKPQGYLSDCPGFNASVTISEKSQRMLSVTGFRASGSKKIYQRTFRLKTAAKSIAKDRNWDFKRKKTVAFFDGYLSTTNLPVNMRLVEAYIKNNYNVLIFESLAVLLYPYPVSARITKPLGLLQGEFLAELIEFGLKPDNLELLGSSMGGHTIVFAARNLHQLTGKKPARLTGLDPAGPCFRNLGSEYSIRPALALHVDVLHTNIDGLGTAEPLGHVDFYVNGGEYQPLSAGGFILPCLTLCSHLHAFLYWWQAMEHPNGGIFYLPTRDSFPYYAGTEGLHNMYTPTSYLKDLSPVGDLGHLNAGSLWWLYGAE